jgi:methylmalonyl-CoA/ethylmalonyl-CoA epimerase
MHIGIATKDLEQATRVFSRLLGTMAGEAEEVPDQQVRTVSFDVGGAGIELLEPTSRDSPIARFIEKRGEGIHHISFEVDDIEAEIARLEREGFQMVDRTPRAGVGGHRIAFLHPKSTHGVLVEISQRSSTSASPE